MEWLSYSRNNQEMVDKFTRLGIIESSEVERAFRCVSRAAFVPDDLIEDAFKDTPLRGSHHVHLSAPHMYAAIFEELELDVGMSFLNVGSGTGYFSTLAGYIIKKDGINHGIELHEDLVNFANERVTNFLQNGPPDAKDICPPVFICGNACRLDAEQMKYDRLYCGAACSQSIVKFFLKMVKVGGFLIAPVGFRLLKLKRVSLKEGRQSVINDVSFAPLVLATPEEMKLPKLRFPDTSDKKMKKSSIVCDVSFPVSKTPGRKLLARLRAFQEAMACLQTGRPLPMPYCYVPCFDDLARSKARAKRAKGLPVPTTATSSEQERDAVDTQIDFFTKDQVVAGSFGMDVSLGGPQEESSRRSDACASGCRQRYEFDYERLSADKTWFEVLEHYYSVCATTETRKNECTNIKMERTDEQLTFKKYAKQMGLIPSRSRKRVSVGESKGDAPVFEEVANDIVENLLEEVICQVDDNDLAEDFLAAVTGTGPYSNGDVRRRSSVARAIILDNLPRLRAFAGESGGLSQTLQGLIRNFNSSEDNAQEPSERSHDNAEMLDCKDSTPRDACLRNVHTFVNSVIADIDKQILHDIVQDSDIGNCLEIEEIPDLPVEGRLSDSQSAENEANNVPDRSSGALSASSDLDRVLPGLPDPKSASSKKECLLNTSDKAKTSDGCLQSCYSESAVPTSTMGSNGSLFKGLYSSSKGEEANTLNLNSSTVYVKREGSGYFDSKETAASCERSVASDHNKLLSSFVVEEQKARPNSDRLSLLEQKSTLMKMKVPPESFTEFSNVTLPNGEEVNTPVSNDKAPKSFAIHENPFRDKFGYHGRNDGDYSSSDTSSCCCSKFQLNFCLEKSSESTPNKCPAHIRPLSSCNMGFSNDSTDSIPCSCCLSSSGERQCNNVHSMGYSLGSSPEKGCMRFSVFGSESSNYSSELLDASDSVSASFNSHVAAFGEPAGCSNRDQVHGCSLSAENGASTRSGVCLDGKFQGGFERGEVCGASSSLLLHRSTDLKPAKALQGVPCASPSIDCVTDSIGDNVALNLSTIDKSSVSKDSCLATGSELDTNCSLFASTPLHKRYSNGPECIPYAPDQSTTNLQKNETKISTNDAHSVLTDSIETDAKSNTVTEQARGLGLDSFFMTSYTPSFKKKRKPRKSFTGVKMDVSSSKLLRCLPGKEWGLQHDKELILYLSRKEKASSHVAFSNCCPNVINPKCFSSTDLIQYKRICSYPVDVLVRRGIVLRRLAEALDSVMNVLVGPSLLRDQFKTPIDEEYPLKSLSEASFESTGIPFDFKFGEEKDDGGDKSCENSNGTHCNKAKNSSKDLMETMTNMMSQELENIRKQKEIVRAKLNLYDNLNAEYNEQLRLIKEQVGLVEEQHQLLQTRLRMKGAEEDLNQTLVQTEKMIQERKIHKKQLTEQLEAIKKERAVKLAEHESLLEIYRQLTGLENGLLEERNSSLKMGTRYLENANGKLNQFAKCVKQSNEIVNQLTAWNEGGSNEMASITSSDIVSEEVADTGKTALDCKKYRYHPHLLLAKSRFLFPLTSKRLTIIKDLLRMSETDSLHPCFVARIDRRVPLKERHKYPPSNTVFMQTYNTLKNKELNFRNVKRNFEKLWEVKFIGEGIIDQGGGFRDSFAEIADELCPASPEIKECLQLFIKSPNQQNETGDHRDAYLPNPSCKDFHLYTWIGKLIGAAFRTDETLPLAFPPFIWKLLIGEDVTWANDYIGVDQAIVRVTDGIELLDEESYEEFYQPEQFFSVHLSNGAVKELIANGSEKTVEPKERSRYATLVRKARVLESVKQVKAMRNGLITVVPDALLSCLTWQDFERGVCGSPEITVADLKANCRYELDLSPAVDCVAFLWEALASFTSEERSRFVRFVTGRKRLPSPFFISRSLADENSLPTASTCGSNLFLPNYTNAKIAAEKLRYAINNCVSIDTDTSPW